MVAAATISLCMTACRSSEPQRQVVVPADFTTKNTTHPQPNNRTDVAVSDSNNLTANDAGDNSSATESAASDTLNINTAAPTTQSASSNDGQPRVFTLDAMVGQVNGRAIYANTVFEPIGPQLAALGRTLPPSVFKQRAAELIVGQLQTLVTNALILGEAERDLSVQERHGLLAMLQTRREELLRQLGEGSESVADEVSFNRTGKNVSEQVKDYREQVIVGRYISNQVRTKINVSRKDIERYYESHRAEFNPPPGRTIRLIMTSSADDADHLEKLLATGTSFDEVAKSSANKYRPAQGGLMADRITGDKFSGFDALNQAMLKLKAGQHSPRLAAGGSHWWIKVETYDSGKGRSLEEVQLEVRYLLEDQQRNALGMAFRRKLLDEGSYNPVNEMAIALVDIAMSRYSQPAE